MADPGRETQYTESDVIEVFRERTDYAEPLTASEVAEQLGCSRRTALNRLHDVQEETDVTSKKVGGRSRVWWVPVIMED
jgi:MarR-like DNA-binding transcriptional regulator SgrR of sgrS sRNA